MTIKPFLEVKEFLDYDAVLTATCPMCHKKFDITVNRTDLAQWRQGKLAQEAFPYLTPPVREQLITGTCGSCFDELFKNFE